MKPDVKRGNLSPEEQLLILELHAKWGNRSLILLMIESTVMFPDASRLLVDASSFSDEIDAASFMHM